MWNFKLKMAEAISFNVYFLLQEIISYSNSWFQFSCTILYLESIKKTRLVQNTGIRVILNLFNIIKVRTTYMTENCG